MTVQSDDVERHRGDVHSKALSIREHEAQSSTKLPLSLQSVDEGEGEAQGVDQQVGCTTGSWHVVIHTHHINEH